MGAGGSHIHAQSSLHESMKAMYSAYWGRLVISTESGAYEEKIAYKNIVFLVV